MKLNAKLPAALAALVWCGVAAGMFAAEPAARKALVLQSDFGVKDGAVAAMKGVAVGIDPELRIYD